MITAGITGGIGSGKSLVCNILLRLGARIFNADDESKFLLDHHPELRKIISAQFGKHLYSIDGINRKAFAHLIFSDPEKLNLANSIIHPFVHQAFERWIEEQKEPKVVFMEAAILFETGGWKKLDRMILVYAPLELRLQRVTERDHVDRSMILERMKYQMPDEEKIKSAHFLINNDGKVPLLPQVIDLWSKLNR